MCVTKHMAAWRHQWSQKQRERKKIKGDECWGSYSKGIHTNTLRGDYYASTILCFRLYMYIHTFSAYAAGCHNIMVIFFKEYNYMQQQYYMHREMMDGVGTIVELERLTHSIIKLEEKQCCIFQIISVCLRDWGTVLFRKSSTLFL